MAEKVSLKIFIVISLFCGILSACRHPIDIQAFMEDEEIQKIIAATKVAVKLSDDSDKGLTGGNRKITGLDPNKYYMVEKEIDEDGITEVTPTDYPKFVTEYTNGGSTTFTPGQLIGNDLLEYITRIVGKTIIGLTNLHTYTVKSAQNFTNATSFSYTDSGGVSNQPVSVNSNGELVIPSPTGSLSLVELDADYNGYEVMAVAVSTTPLTNFGNSTKTISGAAPSFPLEGENSIVDYVFFKKATLDFNVLRVIINSPGSLALTVTFPIDDMGNVTPTDPSVAKSTLIGGAYIVLTAPSALTGISWSISGDTITGASVTSTGGGTNNCLTIDNSTTFLKYFAGSSFVVNVKGTIDGKQYSKSVKITLTGGP